jgi:hypothetical protein
MTPITVLRGLPFIAVTIVANNQRLVLEQVLLDTGSASTIFKTDTLEKIGVKPELADKINFARGIGGTELVVRKQIEAIEVGELRVSPAIIQLGALNYGIVMDGIIGVNFLLRVGALVDFKEREIRKG